MYVDSKPAPALEILITRAGCNIPDLSQDAYLAIARAINNVLERNAIFEAKYYTQYNRWEKSPYDRIAGEKTAEKVQNAFARKNRLPELEQLFDKTMNLENHGMVNIKRIDNNSPITWQEWAAMKDEIINAVKQALPETMQAVHVQASGSTSKNMENEAVLEIRHS